MTDDPVVHVFRSVDTFCRQLYKLITQETDNVFLSPFCLHATISMVYEGACGDTQKELETALRLQSPEKNTSAYRSIFNNLLDIEHFQMYLYHKIYAQNKFRVKDSYIKVVTEDFLSEIETINFVNNVHAAQVINSWAVRSTNNRVTNVVASGDFSSVTRMLLINAAYFTGDWLHKFNRQNTKMEPFRLSDMVTADCEMMALNGHFYYVESKELNAEIVKLPFINNLFSFMVLLPKSVSGMERLERQMQFVSFTELIDTMNNDMMVNVCLPKFKMEKKYDLTNTLKRVGFRNVYTTLAQFHNMVEQGNICISKIIQKASMGINEEGIDAASREDNYSRRNEGVATSTPQCHFIANHPFMFALILKYEANYCPIFIGKVYRP